MSRLEGQAAIVTGAVRGIGLGIARRLAAEGCSIVVWDGDVTEFGPVSAGFTPLISLPVDVADRLRVEQALAATMEAANRIDILVASKAVLA